MSLLNDLFAKPLEPGYEEAAARDRAAGKHPGGNGPGGTSSGVRPRPPVRFSPALALGMVALGLLVTAAVLQVRDTANVVSSERQGLIEQIYAEDERVSQLQGDINALESEINSLEETLLQDSTTGQQVREEVEGLQASAGAIAVTGPGVVVTVDDADEAESADEPGLARVLDVDLRQVVNGLWAAGAEAVSINGERITGLTAIRSAEGIVQINYRPMAAPYEIQAIGDPEALPGRFGDGSGGQWLRSAASQNGLQFSVRREDSLTLSAGNTPLTYATPGGAS
ncbi:DUF881 domain-containing protein [Jiangella asiatica]|uniref:DUF881 domain-containing protein n=1 Tax=Jiangella asiatica TaxID=2530372 RepID=A0A4R5DED4_9ACTN|nr:DUF881 domain-containing protein [Jiangella asiatica]TDE12226.1 DUF881 domain-containing protein [Jiangella asiatica]